MLAESQGEVSAPQSGHIRGLDEATGGASIVVMIGHNDLDSINVASRNVLSEHLYPVHRKCNLLIIHVCDVYARCSFGYVSLKPEQ